MLQATEEKHQISSNCVHVALDCLASFALNNHALPTHHKLVRGVSGMQSIIRDLGLHLNMLPRPWPGQTTVA